MSSSVHISSNLEHLINKGGKNLYLQEWTGGKGIDVVIEMLANVNLSNDLNLLAKKGRAMVGNPLSFC